MYGHVKPTIRDANADNIILHVGTIYLNSGKTSSQIVRSIIELAVSLKTNTNIIMISLIAPQNDHLNNKANKVNNGRVNICGERLSVKTTSQNYSFRYAFK